MALLPPPPLLPQLTLWGKSRGYFCNHRKPTIPAHTLYPVFSAVPDREGAMRGGGEERVVAQAATVVQVTSGEVSSITGTESQPTVSAAVEVQMTEAQGRKCLAQGHTASCSAGWDQSASRVGQCWAALMGVVCRSGRPGNRQCLGTEGGERRSKAASKLWLALGRSGLRTVPSTPPKPTPLLKY